ncbi:MAG: hypothetical protein QM741_00855 [Rudaea sp.]|uniref:hypothetical protein n=1 Tax=Rudaea sp. TaxID=2136325 RepID=UPI0039E4178F
MSTTKAARASTAQQKALAIPGANVPLAPLPNHEPQEYRCSAIVYVRQHQGTLAARVGELCVGTFSDADKAWEEARAHCDSLNGIAYTVKVQQQGAPATQGQTHPHARRLIQATQEWAQQNLTAEQAKVVKDAMKALDDTLMTCWTEVDEALCPNQAAWAYRFSQAAFSCLGHGSAISGIV